MSTFFQWLIDILRDVKFWFVVNPWEKGVRVRLGKYATILDAGFHWKFPVLDEVFMVNTRLRLGPSSTQTISAKDGQVITIGIQLGFSITEPLMALSTYLHPENSLAVLVHNHVAEYIMDHTVEALDITELEAYVVNGLKDSDPNDGMTVEFIKVTNLIISSPALSLRLIHDDIVNDYSSDVNDRSKWQPNITQW